MGEWGSLYLELIHVDLEEGDEGGSPGQFHKDGGDDAAGSAPGGREVHHHLRPIHEEEGLQENQ